MLSRTIKNYLTINNFVAKEYPASFSKEELVSNNEYVIEQYWIEYKDGNREFKYLPVNQPNGEVQLERRNWKINRVHSFCSFRPKEIVFEIFDPLGLTDKDIRLKRKKTDGTGSHYYVSFPGLGVEALNEGLQFFLQVSKYKNWYEFLLSGDRGEFTSDTLEPFHISDIRQQELIVKVQKLEVENHDLKEKLQQLKSILA